GPGAEPVKGVAANAGDRPMKPGIPLIAGTVALVLLAAWFGRTYLTMSPVVALSVVVLAALIGAATAYFLGRSADARRLGALEGKWKDRLAALQAELGHISLRSESLTADLKARETQIAERESAIVTLSGQVAKIESLQAILRDKDRLIAELDGKVSGLTSALEEREGALARRDAELAGAGDRHTTLEQEISALKSDLAGMVPKKQIDHVSAKLTEAQSASAEEVAKLKRQLTARDQSLKDAAAKIAALESRSADAASVRERLADADARASEVAQRIEDLEREVAARVPAADYHAAKSELAELRGAHNKFVENEVRLRSSDERANELAARVQELEERLRDSVPRAEYEALSANLRSLVGGEPTQSQ
ncbi:MAG: hypothetical protein ACT4R6_09650, partial [Gemmatimonadaceae bacterium]